MVKVAAVDMELVATPPPTSTSDFTKLSHDPNSPQTSQVVTPPPPPPKHLNHPIWGKFIDEYDNLIL